jgi:hypothetical protein
MALGTVLPTAEILARGDAHAAWLAGQQHKAGAALNVCAARTVGGETRYYKTSTKYAVISRGMQVRWFEVRADGDYPVRG